MRALGNIDAAPNVVPAETFAMRDLDAASEASCPG
jgi:hypothetical protein